MHYDDVTKLLIESYDGAAAATRDGFAKESWKIAERAAFLDRLRADGARSLVEIGAGTGQDSAAFARAGLSVTATDLSPAMVELCQSKGIEARVADVLHLDLPLGAFDAAYSLNCLLHVPNADLEAALDGIARVLRRRGLFFLGLWGGADDFEGQRDEDRDYTPPRFFSFRSPETVRKYVAKAFDLEDFHLVPVGERRFQSWTLRRRG